MSERLNKILALLEQSPRDTFLLYAAGMECKKLKDFPRALEFFRRTTEIDPGYCYAYYQQGQTHELAGDPAAAVAAYRAGIAAAEKANDPHARGEIEAALAMIG